MAMFEVLVGHAFRVHVSLRTEERAEMGMYIEESTVDK